MARTYTVSQLAQQKVRGHKYYLAHLEQFKAASKKRWLLHPEKHLAVCKKYRLTHKEKEKNRHKKYLLKHPGYNKAYQQLHKKEISDWQKNKHLANPEKRKIRRRKYYLENCELVKKRARDYFKTPQGRITSDKHCAKRRMLGFIPLNKPFKHSVGHHVDHNKVIYIPIELHKSIWHSVLNDINMNKINVLAYQYLNWGQKAYLLT